MHMQLININENADKSYKMNQKQLFDIGIEKFFTHLILYDKHTTKRRTINKLNTTPAGENRMRSIKSNLFSIQTNK